MANISTKPTAIVIFGPTACGKSELSLMLCEHLQAEIISVDSALIYQGMDIGTAKPHPAELNRVPHHLIDILDPNCAYSVANFYADAVKIMQDITARGKIPLLVGGTMLYFKSLLFGLSPLPASCVHERERILQRAQQYGWQSLHAELASVDPLSASNITEYDRQRICRALEVFYLSGKPMSELQRAQGKGVAYNLLQFSLEVAHRDLLHQRIEQRFDEMIRHGFIDEVHALFKRGDLHEDLPSIRSVGYRQLWHYFQGKISLDEACYRAICATRQLAKRQITWQRGWKAPVFRLVAGDNERNSVHILEKLKQQFAL